MDFSPSAWKYRLPCAAGFGVCAVFLSVRFKAFLIQAWSVELPVAALLVIIAACALCGLLTALPFCGWLRSWVRLFTPWGAAVLLLSVLFTRWQSGVLQGRALEGSGVTMGNLTALLYAVGGGLLLGFFLLCVLAALRDCLPGLKRLIRSIRVRDIVFLLVLLAVINVLVRLYAVNSHKIYYWDNAGYWEIALTLADTVKADGLIELFRTVYDSVLTADYNYIIALPAALLAVLFGSSRYVYLAAIVNFGYFPLCVLVWAAAKRLGHRPLVTAGAALLAAPMLFYNVLVGFIDLAGCVPALLALLLWMSCRDRNDFGRFLLAGLCLACALLLRRWFSFYALAFIAVLLLENVFFRRNLIPVLGTLCSFAFTLLFFFQTLVSGKLLADYSSLYAAYNQGLWKSFLLLFRYFGVLLLAAALLSAVLLLRKREKRSLGFFLLLQPVLCFLLFVQVQTHGQQHLLLYAPAYLCLMLLLFDALAQVPWRRTAAGLTAVCALVPALSPFLPREQPASLSELTEVTVLPSFSWYPPQDENADTIVEIVRRLDEFGEEGYTVGVLASSLVLNKDILTNAEASLSLSRISDVDRSYLLNLPAVDTRDGWWDTIFSCDILVVADPIQTHLGEDNQQVVVLPAQALLSGTGFGAAYERLEDTWTLEDGSITVYVYQRTRDLTEEEKQDLRDQFYALYPQ